MDSIRNKLIGSIGVAALVAGSLVVAPVAAHGADPQTIQVLGINDFHGRISANTVEAGAAVLAGAVETLRAEHPDTVFAAAGDLIGASTFESFIAEDKPTIDALNEAGLEVSAVGNHEFDQGYNDLVNRVMAPYDATSNPYGGAAWEYLGANVRNSSDNSAALPETWIQDFGTVQVGFVGAVTDHLPELVSPAGIAGLTIEAPVVAANREADELKAAGADIVILLVHEGAATTALSSATDPNSDFGEIVTGADGDIDAIISGHTHLAYNHSIPVPQWANDLARVVKNRPVVSAGQYGYNLNQLLFTVDPDSGQVLGVQQKLLPLVTTTPAVPPSTTSTYTPNYPADPDVAAIVGAAVANSDKLGAVALGQISGPFTRAKLANGTTENRGGESTLGNLVAEVQQSATEAPEFGSAQIAFMNPGGLRQDMTGTSSTYPTDLTYKQAAVVQPFANTLVNMQLTGAQIKDVLEEQWQPASSSRPFLRLGISEGFTYTYDPAAAAGSRITQMWLDRKPIDLAASYSVTANSFLASGGDNFTAFLAGTGKRDTGQVDLQAMVDYMAANTPVAVDYTQRSVGVSFPAGAPASYERGQQVTFAVSSLAFSNAADTKDTKIAVRIGAVAVGEFDVDNTIGTDTSDEYGKATVTFTIPDTVPAGSQTITITGTTTGTTTSVPLTVTVPVTSTVTLTASAASQIYGSPNTVTLTALVSTSDGSPVAGDVEFYNGSELIGTAPVDADGKATLALPADTDAGSLTITAKYTGEPTATSDALRVTVDKATSTAALLATKTSYRANPLLPALLIGAVGLNNGQRADGTVQIKQNDVVVATVPVSNSFFVWVVPRNLPRGTYKYVATFIPSDQANVTGVDSNGIFIQIR